MGHSETSSDHIGDDDHPYEYDDLNLGKDALTVKVSANHSAGQAHACIVATDGSARCWGNGNSGRLGSDDATSIKSSSFPPPDVLLTDKIIDVGVGSTHTCILNNKGGIKCFGNGNNGRLGDGATSSIGNSAGEMAAINEVEVEFTVATAGSLALDTSCVITVGRAVDAGVQIPLVSWVKT